MMKKISQALFVLLPAVTFMTATPAKTKAPSTSDADYTYTEDKANFIVTASHPQFMLKLKSNPSTGYTWFLREYDPNLMTPVKHVYQQPAKNLIGAPGYEIWTFHAKPAAFTVPQQTTIRMIYSRPWSGTDNSTQQVFRVTTQGK